MQLRVAGAQIPVTRDVEENLAAIGRAMDFAIDAGAEVLLTPEGSLSGYTPQFDADAVTRALETVTARAREAGLALALGTCFVEPADGRCYNQVRFYDRSGAFLGFHAKILRCGSLTEPPRGEIEHYAAAPLRTFEFNGARAGALICNDLWANPGCTPMPDPHLTQELAKLGAGVVFHAVNGGRNGGENSRLAWQYHEANLRMRARAGRLWIVTADSCYPETIPASSPSGVVDPGGQWAVQVEPRGEQFFVHTLCLNDEDAAPRRAAQV